jgi:hypothetical protein
MYVSPTVKGVAESTMLIHPLVKKLSVGVVSTTSVKPVPILDILFKVPAYEYIAPTNARVKPLLFEFLKGTWPLTTLVDMALTIAKF